MEIMVKIISITIPIIFMILIGVEVYKFKKYTKEHNKTKKEIEELKKKMEK